MVSQKFVLTFTNTADEEKYDEELPKLDLEDVKSKRFNTKLFRKSQPNY